MSESSGEKKRPRRAHRRRRSLLFMLAAPAIILAFLGTYLVVEGPQSAKAAVIDPGDCSSLDQLSFNFVNEMTNAQAAVTDDENLIRTEGPTQNGTDAAYRLIDFQGISLPQWEQQRDILVNDEASMECSNLEYPFIEDQVVDGAQRVNVISSDLTSAEEDELVEDVISAEEDGYDPCEDTATVQSAPAAANTVADSPDAGQNAVPLAGTVVKIDLSESKYPESTKHIKDAIAAGKPKVLTINRAKCKQNRKASLKGVKRVKGKDRDEYPFAMTDEGGAGASVRAIDPSDNRGSGSTVGSALRGQADGTQFEINFVP